MYSPKKTTSGFSIPPQTLQSGMTKPSLDLGQHVAVGAELDALRHGDPRVRELDAHGEVAPVEDLPAMRAEHPPHRAVQLDDAPAAGAQVQAVHVLRDDAGRDAGALEVGERGVAVVGRGDAENACQPRWLPTQYRRRAASLARNCWAVIGVRVGAPLPR